MANGRALITHLACVAVGLALGIFLTRGNAPKDVTEPVAEPSVAAPPSSAPAVPVAPSQMSPPAPSDDPQLLKLRADYEDQIRRGEQRQALLILQEMEKRAPRSLIYLELNSEYQIYTRDWPTAAAASKACVAVFPKSRLCYRNLAQAVGMDGNIADQSAAVNACLQLEPNDPHCRNMLGMVQMNGGDFASAVATYERLIRENGSFGTRFAEDHLEWHLGLALEGAGRREEAIDHLENACRRNNNQACEKIEDLSQDAYN